MVGKILVILTEYTHIFGDSCLVPPPLEVRGVMIGGRLFSVVAPCLFIVTIQILLLPFLGPAQVSRLLSNTVPYITHCRNPDKRLPDIGANYVGPWVLRHPQIVNEGPHSAPHRGHHVSMPLQCASANNMPQTRRHHSRMPR